MTLLFVYQFLPPLLICTLIKYTYEVAAVRCSHFEEWHHNI